MTVPTNLSFNTLFFIKEKQYLLLRKALVRPKFMKKRTLDFFFYAYNKMEIDDTVQCKLSNRKSDGCMGYLYTCVTRKETV